MAIHVGEPAEPVAESAEPVGELVVETAPLVVESAPLVVQPAAKPAVDAQEWYTAAAAARTLGA